MSDHKVFHLLYLIIAIVYDLVYSVRPTSCSYSLFFLLQKKIAKVYDNLEKKFKPNERYRLMSLMFGNNIIIHVQIMWVICFSTVCLICVTPSLYSGSSLYTVPLQHTIKMYDGLYWSR